MSNSKHNFKNVILYSVGGNIKERKERAWFYDICGPRGKNIYNGTFQVLGREWSLVPELSTPFSTQELHVDFDENMYPPISFCPVPGYKNLVLNVGHSDPKTFSDLMVKNEEKIDFLLIQGPGFNFMDFYPKGFPNWLKLQKAFGSEKALGGPGRLMGTCFPHPAFKQQLAPFYTSTQWECLFKLYPIPLQKQRISTLVQFWITRSGGKLLKLNGDDGGQEVMTGAFYRQFLLNEIVRHKKCLELELAIVMDVKSKTGNLCDSLISDLSKIIHSTVYDEKEDMNEIHKRVFENIFTAYRKWKNDKYDKLTFEQQKIVRVFFYNSILSNINEKYFAITGKEFQIKEYDGFSAHILARTAAGIEAKLSPEFHYNLMLYILSGGQKGNLPAGYISVLKKALSGVIIHIFHDLGLDPQGDDYLAIKIIDFLTN